MAWQVEITDLGGIVRQYVTQYASVSLTRRLCTYSECHLAMDVREVAAAELLIGERALLVYDDAGTARFFGQVWEPFEMNEAQAVVVARDPVAGLASRRVRSAATYTAQDAGAIVTDRVSVQNGYRDTFLNVNVQAVSTPRTISYTPGTQESDVLDGLANMSGGFFYRVDPLVGTPGKMGTLEILYPDAGQTRSGVAFGYGENTVGNLAGFKLTKTLPLTRATASSQNSAGGRIAAAAEDAAASTQYGLFDDETTYSDISDTALLQAAADASTKPTPPLTIELTPNRNAPMLFTDFDVGDFVRLHVAWGAVSIYAWVRVVEATVSLDAQGIPTLTSVVVETLSGARPNVDPTRLFRAQLDAMRAQTEALTRRVQAMEVTQAAPPPPPTSSGGSTSTSATPTDPAPPPPPPPPAPPAPPTISISASGVNYVDGGVLHRGVQVDVTVNTNGLSGTVTITCGGASATLGGSGSAFLSTGSGPQTVNATVTTSAGSASDSATATVPSVTAE